MQIYEECEIFLCGTKIIDITFVLYTYLQSSYLVILLLLLYRRKPTTAYLQQIVAVCSQTSTRQTGNTSFAIIGFGLVIIIIIMQKADVWYIMCEYQEFGFPSNNIVNLWVRIKRYPLSKATYSFRVNLDRFMNQLKSDFGRFLC